MIPDFKKLTECNWVSDQTWLPPVFAGTCWWWLDEGDDEEPETDEVGEDPSEAEFLPPPWAGPREVGGGEKAVVLPVSTVLSSDSIDVGSTPPLTGEGEPPLVAKIKRTAIDVIVQGCTIAVKL